MTRLIWSALLAASVGTAAAAETINLPPPHTEGGMPLMQALQARHSSREFAPRPLPLPVLSDLLWAAGGVNRAGSGKRTAPSARDSREIAIYVITAEGAQVFDAATHTLRRVVDGDIRVHAGTQDFVAQAPLNLVYVADMNRLDTSEENKRLYAAADAGVIAENVYLYCASAGLNTVVRASVDRPALAAALKLAPNQQIMLAQTVGYPK